MPKKVLVAVSALTPGSGLSRYVFSLCRLLSKNYEVMVLTTHGLGDEYYSHLELKKISPGIKLYSVGRNKKLIKYLSTIKLIREISPDFIVNNYNGVIQFLLPFISKKIKVVHVLHSDTEDFYRIGSINGRKVHGWIAPTNAIADHFNAYTSNKYESRVKVIPHGVEEAVFKERNNKVLEIVYAGVLYEHKGVRILPDIIKRLKQKKLRFRFTIIGRGELGGWLEEQFTEEIAAGEVTMTGVIPHDKVYEKMSRADIFLYPTHLDAFGLVIAEAMMNGAVPVVTWLPGITDNLIKHGEDGFLIKQDDIETFVSTIMFLYENSDKRHKMNFCAHKKSHARFSHGIMKKNYEQYISELLK